MDLWIRSQDRKRLIPKPNLYVVYSEENKCAYIGDTMVGHIAKYVTEERAIEVLDEIQTKIMDSYQLYEINRVNLEDCTGTHKFKIPCQLPVIYEMPK